VRRVEVGNPERPRILPFGGGKEGWCHVEGVPSRSKLDRLIDTVLQQESFSIKQSQTKVVLARALTRKNERSKMQSTELLY